MWPAMYGMPGFGYGEVQPPARSRRRERDDSSDSRDRHRDKRKRDSKGNSGGDARGKEKDKKAKKEKDGKERRSDDVVWISGGDRDDRGRRKDPPSEQRRQDPPSEKRRQQPSSKSHQAARGTDNDPLRVGEGERKPGRPAASPATSPKAPEPETPAVAGKSKKWRTEVDEEEDARDLSDDDEALEKKLEEAKRRREAIKAKMMAKEQGEEPSKGKAAPEAGPAAAEPETKESEAKEGGEEGAEGAGDMFDVSVEAAEKLKKGERFKSESIKFTGASGDDWDDEEGYYMPKIGEVMGDRYLIVETAAGRGVFSNVVKAKDQQAGGEEGLVAIKVMRNNSMMTKAAEKEVAILEKLNNADKKNKRHIVRLLATFAYRKHFCLVFECMWDDLRAALKKYTKNKGMSLHAVRSYTQQLMVALAHMRQHGIIHADMKPDNILIGKGNQTVKICDLGTALEIKDVMASPYLASRFYRPPEVILGCDFNYAVDVWALGCTLFELFTGRVLLNSKSNNDHLKKIMDLRGKLPGKVIKKGAVWKTHFTDELDFKHQVEDPGSGQQVTKIVTDFTVKGNLKDMILDRVGAEKRQSTEKEDQLYVKRAIQFADLLEQLLTLDPEKRARPEDALQHAFLQDKIGASQDKAAKR